MTLHNRTSVSASVSLSTVVMYSTKVFNAKVAESYLNIGDPYDKQHQVDGRRKGKQFLTVPPKTGQLHGYFTPLAYTADMYQDSNGYRISQPRANRKLGFGSFDAHRRDEFTLAVRAQQYREHLDHEKKLAAESAYSQSTGGVTVKESAFIECAIVTARS